MSLLCWQLLGAGFFYQPKRSTAMNWNTRSFARLYLSLTVIGITSATAQAGPTFSGPPPFKVPDFFPQQAICPCFSSAQLLVLEPSLCTHQDIFIPNTMTPAGSVTAVGQVGQDASFGASAASTVGTVGRCWNPTAPDGQTIDYTAAKACERLIEDTVGPCTNVAPLE
jgi:hypothetical protein